MKKILLTTTLIFFFTPFAGQGSEAIQQPTPNEQPITSDNNNTEEVKFVNPLFYRRLVAVSQIARDTYLTPTSIRFAKDIIDLNQPESVEWQEGTCDLLENEQDYVVLKCVVHIDESESYTYTSKYVIVPCEKANYCSDDAECKVVEYNSGQATYEIEKGKN